MDKISHLYDDYADILKEFGENRIRERFNDLYVACNEFIDNYQYKNSVKINDFILMHAVLDYFTDISRLHGLILYDSLYYYLKYRNCNSQALELALLSFGAGIVAANHDLNMNTDSKDKE